MSILASKWAGKCRTCGKSHAVGDAVWWARGVKGVQCLGCHDAENVAPTFNRPVPVAPTAPREKTRTVREFGSWGEFVAYAEEHANSRDNSHAHDPSDEWYGSKSFAAAVKLAKHGWSEVRPEVDALTEKIDAVIAPTLQPAFQSYFDVSGGGVDIGRFLDGEPECMVETRLVEIAKPGRVVSILVDGFYSQSIKPADIIARGVAIVALVDSLEKLQHSTEIWYETSFRGNPLTYLVKLKGAEDMLDIDALMFAIAHPSSFRRINFAAQERVGENREFRVGPGNNYGGPDGLHMGERVGASVQLPRLVHGDPTADAEVWIREILSKFGLVKGEE